MAEQKSDKVLTDALSDWERATLFRKALSELMEVNDNE